MSACGGRQPPRGQAGDREARGDRAGRTRCARARERSAQRRVRHRARPAADRRAARRSGRDGAGAARHGRARARCCASTGSAAAGCRRRARFSRFGSAATCSPPTRTSRGSSRSTSPPSRASTTGAASTNLGFRNAALNARNAFAPVKGDEQHERYGFSLNGPLWKQHTSLSLSADGIDAFDTKTIVAALPSGYLRRLDPEAERRAERDARGSSTR